MLETKAQKLAVGIALVLAVGVVGGGVYTNFVAGDNKTTDTETGLSWADHPECTQNQTAQNVTTTTGASERGMVLTSTPTAGVTVDVDEQNESVRFVIVQTGNLDLAYVVGDHRYENDPVICEREITFSGNELKEHGELQILGVISGQETVVQAVEYDFRENVSR